MHNETPAHIARTAYLPHVDGLRAIAILSVMIYHLNPAWLPGGFSGVDIFFVMSGFIVSASVGSIERTGLPKFIAFFYARRFLRIGPALIASLLATCLATALLIPSAWMSRAHQETGLYAFFGLSTFILARTSNDYFSPIAEFNPYTHTWSLGVEEQFYVLFPLMFFAWLRPGKRRVAAGVFVAALLASLGCSAWLGQTDRTAAFYMIASRFWQLAAGVLLYQFMALSGRRFDAAEPPAPRWHAAGALFSLLLAGYGFCASRPDAFPFPGAIPSVLGALGLLFFLHGENRRNPLMRLLASRPMLFTGRISYSLYLWHWPVFVLFRWTTGTDTPPFQAAALLLSFALAAASFHWVETPLRYLPALRRAPRHAVVGLGLAAIGASAWLATQINAAQPSLSVSTVTRHAGDWYPDAAEAVVAQPGCELEAAGAPMGTAAGHVVTFTRKGCERPVTAPRVFAIGDSPTIAYIALFKSYVLETGAPVTVYNNGGCPFLCFLPAREDSENCKVNAKAALDDMLGRIAPGDVVFLASLRIPRFADQWIRFPDEEVREALFSERAAEGRAKAVAEAGEILRRLQARGARIVFEAPKPIFRSPPFRCAESVNRTNPACRDGTDIDRAELEALRKPALDAYRSLSGAAPGIRVWDPLPTLCPAGTRCSAFLDGRPLFFDADHVSAHGNRLLLPSFRAFLQGGGATR